MTDMRKVTFAEIEEAASKIGYEVTDVRNFSTHPGDWYLKVVKAFNPNKMEFAVWLYNATFESLYEGFYTENNQSAHDKFLHKK